MSAEVFTSGRWTVREGMEQAFVDAWREFATWSKATYPDTSGWVVLLKARDALRTYVSVGPWATDEAVASWRESEGFRARIGNIRPMLEGFEATTLDGVIELGQP